MNRRDKIKLAFSRNWKLPGQKRMLSYLSPSAELTRDLKNGITWLVDESIAIYTSADNYIENSILINGTYEPEINKLFSISLKEGDTAIDVGANIGLQSLRMARHTGKTGRIICFEPLEFLQKKLLKNIQLNRIINIQLLPCALSDQKAEKIFSIDEKVWNQGNFSLGEKGSGNEFQLVQIETGDNVPEINQLTNLHLVKIDVEGFEFNVLKGLKNAIDKFRPRIIFEFDQYHWRDNDQSIIECYQFLKEYNYSIFQIYLAGCELILDPYNIKSGNLFCIPDPI